MRFHHQAYDPALELRDPASLSPGLDRSMRLALLRAETEREIGINLLFGRSLVMPVGHITDSPLFLDLFGRFFAAFTLRKAAIDANFAKEGVVFRPFRVTLYPGLNRIRDVAAHYRWGPARFAMFNHLPLAEQHDSVERLCSAIAGGKFSEAGRIVGDPRMSERYREIDEYFDASTGVAPLKAPPVDFLGIVNAHILKLADQDVDLARDLKEARDTVLSRLEVDPRLPAAKMTGKEAAERLRGAWYYHGEVFGTAWPGIAGSLDAALATNLMAMHDAKAGAFVAPIARDPLPELATRLSEPAPTIDWNELLKQFESVDLRRELITFQLEISNLTGAARNARFRRHAEFVIPYANAIGIRSNRLAAMLDRLNHRTRLLRSAEPVARQLLAAGVTAGANHMLPGSGTLVKIVIEPVRNWRKDQMPDQIILKTEWVRRQYRTVRLKLLGTDLRALGSEAKRREFTLHELRNQAPDARDSDIIEMAQIAARGGRIQAGLLTAEVGEYLSLPPEQSTD